MDKCLYYLSNNNLTFNGQEHIISAALGGKEKLPKGTVSDQANNLLSKIELEVLRNSPVALSRYFYGPGKRGSLSEKKTTKSSVLIMRDDYEKIKLGYLELGIPSLIPQIIVSEKNQVHFHCNSDIGDEYNQLLLFIEKLKKFKRENLKEIKNKEKSKAIFILGFHEDKWYTCSNDTETEMNIENIISKISPEIFLNSRIRNSEDKNKVQGYLRMNDNYFRYIGKTAFNAFAFLYGHEIALKSEFDEIRNWIINGGKNNFVSTFNDKSSILGNFNASSNSHSIIFNQKNGYISARVCLYGEVEPIYWVILSENFSPKLRQKGFICDWEQRKEMNLSEFLKRENTNNS